MQSVDTRVQSVIDEFVTRYGSRPATELYVAIAPGRVNLIGEHTDYNDGFVLPIAINRDVVLVGAKRSDKQVRVYSMDFKQEAVINLDAISFDKDIRWSNYVRGVLSVLKEADHSLVGMDFVMTGNVPQGSGLSSSAAIEVGVLVLTQAISGLDISGVDGARLCQRAENTFVGVNCGIMDQFISRLGKTDCALLIDCRSLDYRHIPWRSGDMSLLVVDTKVERGLVDSEYNQRRQECETGVAELSKVIPNVKALRDVSVQQMNEFGDRLDPMVRARCAHVVGENQRVIDAVAALEAGDWKKLGALMYESHESLRDLYQVSCRQLDLVVEIARSVPGVYGARMTGAGFGGCAIALVAKEAVDALQKAILERYQAAVGWAPGLLLTGAADGTRAFTLDQLGRS